MPGGRKPHDLRDRVFGLLVARERVPKPDGLGHENVAWWRCDCVGDPNRGCKGTATVRSSVLVKSRTRSCGCLRFARWDRYRAARAAGQAAATN